MNKDLKEIKVGVSDDSWDEAFIQPGNWRKPGSLRPSDCFVSANSKLRVLG